jgi:hypothetical protein
MTIRSILASGIVATATVSAIAADPSFSIEGKWNTDFGLAQLTENGSKVTGSYAFENGKITGTRSENRLTGQWTQSKSVRRCDNAVDGNHFHGRLVFEFTANEFIGKWGYCDDTTVEKWSGKRGSESSSASNTGSAAPAQPAPTPSADHSAPWVARSFTGPYLPLAGKAEIWSNPKPFKVATGQTTVQSRFLYQKGTTCRFEVQFNNVGTKPLNETVMVGKPGKVAWSQYDHAISIKLNPGTSYAFGTEVRECPLNWGETKEMDKCASCEPIVYFSAQ